MKFNASHGKIPSTLISWDWNTLTANECTCVYIQHVAEYTALGTHHKMRTMLDIAKKKNLLEELVTWLLEVFKRPKRTF